MSLSSRANTSENRWSLASSWRRRLRGIDLRDLAKRVVYFWIVWSALLFVHETGHGLVARAQGLDVGRITVGAGPTIWSGRVGELDVMFRLVPLVGITDVRVPRAAARAAIDDRWGSWAREAATLGGGTAATLALAAVIAGLVMLRERRTGVRWTFGRFVVGDALVITVFNFLPVPPLDGGRALLGAITAMRGAPLPGDVLFWIQAAGLALALLPMTLFTRWTARIDMATLTWLTPRVAPS